MIKKEKINNKDNKKLFNKRNRKQFIGIIFFYTPNNLPYSRYIVSIQKKTGNAVIRNHVKRIARHSLIEIQNDIASGYDFALIFNKKFLYYEAKTSITKILKKFNILN